MFGDRVSVHNGAVPGTTSAFMASCLKVHVPASADIVFVEYSINDKQQHELQGVPNLPAMDNHYRRPFERLLRKLLNYPNRPAVILLNAFKYHGDKQGTVTDYYNSAEGDFHEFGLYYGLPEISVKAGSFNPDALGDRMIHWSNPSPPAYNPDALGDRMIHWSRPSPQLT
eukprot:gene25392-11057_t